MSAGACFIPVGIFGVAPSSSFVAALLALDGGRVRARPADSVGVIRGNWALARPSPRAVWSAVERSSSALHESHLVAGSAAALLGAVTAVLIGAADALVTLTWAALSVLSGSIVRTLGPT